MADKPKVKVGNETWKFRVSAFILDGIKILAEDAAMDKKTIQQILKMEGQGILVNISKSQNPLS